MTQFYTFNSDGSPISDGAVDLNSAVMDLLSNDGHAFEIRHSVGFC